MAIQSVSKLGGAFDARDWGINGASDDDTANFQQMVDDITGSSLPEPHYGLSGATILVPESISLASTIDFYKTNVTLQGNAGHANQRRNNATAGPIEGYTSVIKWIGVAGEDMMRFIGCRNINVKHIRLEGGSEKDVNGDVTNKPSSLLHFYNDPSTNVDDGVGGNQGKYIEECHIGRYTFGATGLINIGDAEIGVKVSGQNSGNDRLRMNRCRINGCDTGVLIDESQSTSNSFYDCRIANCNTGIESSADFYGASLGLVSCLVGMDLDLSANVLLHSHYNEKLTQFAILQHQASIVAWGGYGQPQTSFADPVWVDGTGINHANGGIAFYHHRFQGGTGNEGKIVLNDIARPIVLENNHYQSMVESDLLTLAATLPLTATIDEKVAVPGVFTQGIYEVTANNGANDAARASVYYNASNALAAVENTAFGSEFDFIDDAGVLSIRNVTGTSAQTLEYSVSKIS